MSTNRATRQTWRFIWVMAFMSLLCMGAVIVTLRAVAQAPDAPEQTIQDDPTVAPDPQESADNSVSFPIDI
jgi:hypothetical protein